MNQAGLKDSFDDLGYYQKMIVAVLALAGEPMGRTRIHDHLVSARIRNDGEQLEADLVHLRNRAMVRELPMRGYVIPSELTWHAIRTALDEDRFHDLCQAYAEIVPLRRNWQGEASLRSYRQGLAYLRMALLAGAGPGDVAPLLNACMACHEAVAQHPFIEIFGKPFIPAMLRRVHADLRDPVLAILLQNAQRECAGATELRAWAEAQLESGAASMELRVVMAEHLILCGRLGEAQAMLDALDPSLALYYGSVIRLLRDEHEEALAGFERALKLLRKETGKRRIVFPGLGGHLFVLGLLKSRDPAHHKSAETYLDLATRAVQSHDTAVYHQLSMLRGIHGGTIDAAILPTRPWENTLQPRMFRALLHYWFAGAHLPQQAPLLEEALAEAEAAGYDLVAAQLASVLGRMGSVHHERLAGTLRQRHRFVDLADWFEREEPWQRQLNALINLQPPKNAEVVRESRLAWGIKFDPHYGISEIEAREQKRDTQGGWSRGRPAGMKKLSEEAATLDFLTAQDLNVIATARPYRYFSGSGVRYEFDMDKAVAALVGHPLLYWIDAPGTKVELLPGEPELHVKKGDGSVTITMHPPVLDGTDEVCITRESPNRLRVVRINDEHRRIGAIIGESMTVPMQAEKQVLRAISAIAAVVTVQSDIGGSAADLEQVEADPRLHVNLQPYQQGLRMQVRVRPLPDSGAYYLPGSGAERVIADVNGVRTEARRDLNAERESQRELLAACRALEEAEDEGGEWLLGLPSACLELLSQLQGLDPARVVVAWPQGESFRVTRKVDSQSLRLRIRRDKDWFAADGELQVDEQQVLDLRTLLEMVRSSGGRFVALADNQYLELTAELHRRLLEMTGFGSLHGQGVRVHRLGSFALEELARDAGEVGVDKAWREHLRTLDQQAMFEAEVPGTLQAELRDYQVEGFRWLARLAHWGVGACLADDMGLGKTLQALALLLHRAPGGPALVIAPTSVCLNWVSEAARFAPTLKIKLFGSGDREAMLDQLEPFDVVVASYGLLQLEADRFAKVEWHSIVLDEAQAIKNAATKRSQAVMALKGDFRMAATGTPLENHLGELWNLFRFINPGLLGSMDDFGVRFSTPIERGEDKRLQAEARARLRRLIQPFILRRTKTQVLTELPARTEITLPVELTVDEKALYESLRRDALERLAALEAPERQKSIQILAEMMRLRRACCNPMLVAPELKLASSKLATFSHLLDDLLENRHKVLVFSQFVDHLSLIRAHLEERGIAYQYLDGATPMHERKQRVDAFQAGKGDVFLISLKAGGVGINLTAADYVIHMDPWWNPAVEDQASDRAHRMGQQRPVTIYRLVARATIEEGIVELHHRKRDLAEGLLADADMAARMSPAEMLAMLAQGK